jgi:PAS domain S-box-containing protein
MITERSQESSLWEIMRRLIPEGRALPEKEWKARHYWILILTWLHAVGLTLFGLYQGFGAAQSLMEGAVIAVAAFIATQRKFSRRFRSVAASLGLVTSSAILVHFSNGYIEAHFHFFVTLAIISVYQDWVPYLLAIVFVAVEHGLTGQFVPLAVYNHSDAFAHPWKWAVIHAGFVLGESVALLANWRSSERARAEVDLLLNSAGEGILGLDFRRIITFANPAAANMTGYPLETLVGLPIDRILQDTNRMSPGVDSVHSYRDGNLHQNSDKVVLRGDGRHLFVDATSNPIQEYGLIVGAVVTLKDVTARRQAEEEIKRTLSLLSATLESTADGILVVDKDGREVSLVNDKFNQMWSIPESLTRLITETKDDRLRLAYVTNLLKDPEAFLKKVLELYDHPDSESFDVLELADGRFFERYSKPQRIGDESIGRVWSFRDITERRQASEALENEVRTLESFVYTISHDLKAPVVSVHGMASLLKEECSSEIGEKAKHYIERIIFNANYMEMLIIDLLELSRIGRKQQLGNRAEAREVLEEILKINKESFQEKKIEVMIRSIFPPFIFEHTELTQLFQNLITNAAKFMGDQLHPRIEIGGMVVGTGVEFFVKDNGIGIDPAYHEKIFDIFHRLHDLQVEGTGVGLAIVKKIIHLNRGKIRLESQKGKGTTFFFWLPQTENHLHSESQRPSERNLPI